VIFDFDGTLADSYAAITASINHVREHYHLPPLTEALVRPHVGRGPEHLLRHTVPGAEVAVAVELYRAHHPSVMLSGTSLLDGAREAVTSLHGSGLALAVCSNKPVAFTRDLLAHLRLGACIAVVLGPEDVPRPKPAPDMLKLALEQLKVRAEEALYVGDMTVDIATARAAGVRVWVVPTGSDTLGALKAAGPDRLLTSLSELVCLL
jgi:phosphoglycolate phosphatase